MKYLLIPMLLLLAVSCCRRHYSVSLIDQKSDWMSFRWEGYQSGEKYFDKAAIFVPFSIKGIPHAFEAQFDLGATSTMVYGNSFRPYFDKYREQLSYSDTSVYALWIQSKKQPFFNKATIKIDKQPFTADRLVFFDGYGDKLTSDSVSTSTIKHIGTVGADIFQNKIVLIDYPNQRMKVLDSLLPHDAVRFDFVNARIQNGRIKIPLMIDGEEQWLMFDTGASLFPISTSKKFYDKLADTSILDSIKVNSWGEKYYVCGSPIKAEVRLGKTVLPKRYVYKFTNYEFFYEQEKIMGLTGNVYFLDNVIAIDFKNKKFGVLKAK